MCKHQKVKIKPGDIEEGYSFAQSCFISAINIFEIVHSIDIVTRHTTHAFKIWFTSILPKPTRQYSTCIFIVFGDILVIRINGFLTFTMNVMVFKNGLLTGKVF